MAYGMTPQGFIPKRLAEILGEINAELSEITDPMTGDRPFLNSTDDSVLQQIAAVFAEQLAFCWNASAEGAIQFDPLKNTGAGQSGVVQLNGILRKTGTETIIGLALSGVNGTIIPAGSRVTDVEKKIAYVTMANAVITNGTATVNAAATVKGSPAPKLNTVVFMQTPVAGWKSVTNVSLIREGTAEETDEELRRRQQWSTALPAAAIIESIYAAVTAVPGVKWARVYQNIDIEPDSRGIPGKEVAAVVVGGLNKEIAEALWRRFPAGMVGYGSTVVTVKDAQGEEYAISFTRPTQIPIYVSVTVEASPPGILPQDAEALMKQYIVDYARYGGAGNDIGFPPGMEVVLSRLYTPVNMVSGHRVLGIQIGTSSGSLAAQNIPIAWDEVSEWDVENITVTIN